MKFRIQFDCCDIFTDVTIEADSKENAVCIWERQHTRPETQRDFGLFFTQTTYAEMVRAANKSDANLTVTEVA